MRSGERNGERSGERRSNTGSILGEEAGRRSVLGEDGGRRSVLGGDGGRRSVLGGDDGRRSRLSEESKRSLVGGDLGGRREVGDGAGRQDIHSPSGKKIVVLEDGKRIAAAPIPELERSRGRGGERRMEVNQGQAAHQRRLDVKQDAKEGKIPKSTFERKAEERASTYLHWEDTPSLPSPPATPPAEGEFFLEPFLGGTQNPPHMGHLFCCMNAFCQDFSWRQPKPSLGHLLPSGGRVQRRMQDVNENNLKASWWLLALPVTCYRLTSGSWHYHFKCHQ